jgi:hypothetical protein
MGEKKWSVSARAALDHSRELTLVIKMPTANTLHTYLRAISQHTPGAGYREFLNMLRFYRFHGLLMHALVLRLAVAMEKHEDQLHVIMKRTIKKETNATRLVIIYEAGALDKGGALNP